MVNDANGILLGLYRESTLTRTVEESEKSVKKELFFNKKQYTITENRVGKKLLWRVFDGERELTMDEVINLYAENNLRRLMRSFSCQAVIN